MSVTLTLYKNKSLPNVVSKTLSTGTNVTGNMIGEFDERNPKFEVSKSVSNVDQYDYMLFDGKYYYISTTKQDCTNIIEGQIDPLMSFPDVVGALTCYIERGGTATPYVRDEQDTLLAYQNQEKITFANGFSEAEADGVYILATAQKSYFKTGS